MSILIVGGTEIGLFP
ncbi:unnamed protein product [Larinioides sclopetarius]|uniref:Uncharacterized protein n=1 Tax=Larinioides sclopetarius TaxID=280406 RepID=A0AAV2A5Y3_9ARAC